MTEKQLPKLGRPFKQGSPRDKYLKFYFTETEYKIYENLQAQTKELYKKEGYSFNAPDHFRMFVKFYNHPALLRLFFADFELQGIPKHDFKPFDDFIQNLKDNK